MENSLKDIQETVFGTRRYKNTTLKFAIISTLFAFQVRKTRSLIKGNLLPTAKDPCKTEVSVLGMALKGFVYKKVTVTAPYECDITCRG